MYFAEQIRQCENNSQVRIATLGGKIPALVLSSENDDNEGSYETWFFTYDGQLCKIKTKPGNTVVPYSGTPVMPLGNVDFHLLQSDLLEVTIITQTGENTTVNLHLAGNGGNTDE